MIWGSMIPKLNNVPVTKAGTILLQDSGAYVNPFSSEDVKLVTLRDIAFGLHEVRYNGQTSKPYNVLEHSLLCLSIYEHITRNAPPPLTERDQYLSWYMKFMVLMHDCEESIMKDIPQPLKRSLLCAEALDQYEKVRMQLITNLLGLHDNVSIDFADISSSALAYCYTQLGFETEDPIKQVDIMALYYEQYFLTNHTQEKKEQRREALLAVDKDIFSLKFPNEVEKTYDLKSVFLERAKTIMVALQSYHVEELFGC